MPTPNHAEIVQASRNWVESVVIALNLCPFAKQELVNNRIRFQVSADQTPEALLRDLEQELNLLSDDAQIETTLLIFPDVLDDFYEYNDFLEQADALLVAMDLEGVYQIASMHPNYQFEGTEIDDAENYSNKSPYPMLHLIREDSLEKAIQNYPDVENIPDRNIEKLSELGRDKMESLLLACFKTRS